MKRLLGILFLLATTLLVITLRVSAQTPSPANMGLVPNTPNLLQALDSNNGWSTLGTINPVTHVFTPAYGNQFQTFVGDYGASGSEATAASSSCSGTAITLGSPQDFKNGEGIRVPGCGATFSASQPSASVSIIGTNPVIAATGSWLINATTIAVASCPAYAAAGQTIYDVTLTSSIGTVVSCVGTTLTISAASFASSGSTDSLNFLNSYTYKIASLDGAGGVGIPITTTPMLGPVTPKSLNNMAIAITPGVGSTAYAIWKSVNGGSYAYFGSGDIALTTYVDTGYTQVITPAWIPSSPPSSAQNDWLITQITGGGGTTSLTVSPGATNSDSGVTVAHDDTASINACLNNSAGVECIAPCGFYNITGSVTLPYANEGLNGYGLCTEILASGTANDFSAIGVSWAAKQSANFLTNFYVNDVGKAAGQSIYGQYVHIFEFDNLTFNRPYSGFYFNDFNDLKTNHVRVLSFYGQDATLLALTSDVTNNSCCFDGTDLFGNSNTASGDLTAAQKGFYIDGRTTTIVARNVRISDISGNGMRVSDDIGNANVPQFIQISDLGIEFTILHGIDLEAGLKLNFEGRNQFNGSGRQDFTSCAASSALYIGANVSLWDWDGGTISSATGDGVYVAGTQGRLADASVFWNSNPGQGGTAGGCPGVELAGTSAYNNVVGNNLGDQTHPAWQSYPVLLDSGATYNTVAANNYSGNAANTDSDASASITNIVGMNGGDSAPGFAWDNINSVFGVGPGATYTNNNSRPGFVVRDDNSGGIVQSQLTNADTANSSQACYETSTTVTSATFYSCLNNQTANPIVKMTAGAGVTAGISVDASAVTTAPLTLIGGSTKGVLVQPFILPSGSGPTIASNACGSGTQGTIGGGSTDMAGFLTVGTSTVTSCAVSFAVTHTNSPKECQLTPGNATAAVQATTQAYISTVSATGFTITGAALDSAKYYYVCM